MMEKEKLKEKYASYMRTCAEVNLDAIVNNACKMKEHIAEQTMIMGVIKTDGYGHGAVPVACALESLEFMYGFAVATYEEAHILRRAGIRKPILLLGYSFPGSYERMAEEEIRPAVFRKDSLLPLCEAAKKAGKRIKVHIKVDTGMGRIGIAPDATGIEFVRSLLDYPELEVEGIFTHFARADEADKRAATQQLTIFNRFVAQVEEQLKLHIPIKHCSNSAGILEMPEANLDMVRAGIILYGLSPSEEVTREALALQPALSWRSHIVYIKPLYKGQSVSYGGTYTAEKNIRVATVPVGYGDGYPRGLSGKGHVLIAGKRAPILGRVCMDQFMVDVTDIPEAQEGDLVTLLGADCGEYITAEQIGRLSGRFNYELVCDIAKRVPRVYLREGVVVAVKDYNEEE